MDEYNISVNKLAALTKLSMSSVRNITMGKGAFSPATALRLAKLFGTTPEYWLDIQTRADLAKAVRDAELAEALKNIRKAVKPASAKTLSAGKTATVKGAKAVKPVKNGKTPAADKPKTKAKTQTPKAAAPKASAKTPVKQSRRPRTQKQP
jgi:addiction module HigA family antidote